MDNRNKDTESELRFVNPPGLYNPTPNGYSHLALFPPGWRIILPAGQGGETEDQELSDVSPRSSNRLSPMWNRVKSGEREDVRCRQDQPSDRRP